MSERPQMPPGLMYRRSFRVDMGRAVIEEKWDLDAPGCPMIRSPWHFQPAPERYYIRQVIMTDREIDESRPLLFERDVELPK